MSMLFLFYLSPLHRHRREEKSITGISDDYYRY